MARHKLTDTQAKNAKPGRLSDGGGLYLDTKPGGAKAWVLRIMVKGKVMERGLGSYPQVTLKQAREKSAEWADEIRCGRDPRAVASEAKPARTFKDCALDYIAENESTWKNEVHRHQWRSTLKTYAYPTIGDKPVDQVDTMDVLSILKPIWTTKHETARNLRGRIETILSAAKVEGHRNGDNPAIWKGHLEHVLPNVKRKPVHHAAMPYTMIAEFMAKLRDRNATSARALEFTILTAVRTGETLRATWNEFDIDGAQWVIPAERMKAGVQHVIPLSTRAVEILKEMRQLNRPYVFPGQSRSFLSNMAMSAMLEGIVTEHFKGTGATVNGFRSTFRDWCADQTNYPDSVAEACLAHAVGNAVVAAYRRTTFLGRRESLMNEWATFCST